MPRSVCLFYEQENILYENILNDFAAKIKSIKNLDSVSNSIRKSKETYQRGILNIENKLKQSDVDIELIKQISKKHIKNIKADTKSHNLKKIANSISLNFHNAYSEIKEIILKDLSFSIALLIVVYFISYFLLLNLTLIGSFLGISSLQCYLLYVIFVAPIVEEYAKYISIKKNHTGTYFVVFNIVEFSSYVFKFINVGVSLVPVVITRLLAVMMHAITTYIQYYMRKNSKPEQEEKSAKLGLLAGIIIHFFWNLNSIL